MTKKYVSIIELNNQLMVLANEMNEKNYNVPYHLRFTNSQTEYPALPVLQTYDRETMSVYALPPILHNSGNHLYREAPMVCEMPHILELEYLQQSDFLLTPSDISTLRQSMVLLVMVFIHMNQQALDYGSEHATQHGATFTNQNMILDVLAPHIHEIDADSHPEEVQRVICNAYNKEDAFYPTPIHQPYQSIKNNLKDFQLNTWVRTAASSYQLYQILQSEKSDNSVLFFMAVPLIMVFTLLELETENVKNISYQTFKGYETLIDGGDYIRCINEYDVSENLTNVTQETCTDEQVYGRRPDIHILKNICEVGTQNQNCYDMRYAYYNNGVSDKYYIVNMIQQSLSILKKKVADEQPFIIPIGDTIHYREKASISHVLLNNQVVRWKERESIDE